MAFVNRLFVKSAVGLLVLVVWCSPIFAKETPTLNLFPQDVRSLLSETRDVTAGMEKDLSEIIAGFNQQKALYESAKCEGSTDAGCEQIRKQIVERYKSMLNVLSEQLPTMDRNIRATAKSMANTLRGQVGKKLTPFELQEVLNPKKRPNVISSRFSLSQRLAKYHSLISSNAGQSITDLAAEIYMDSVAASEWTEVILADISRQQAYLEETEFLFALSPEAMGTVENIKTLIFGEQNEPSDVVNPIPGNKSNGAENFVSELEM